MKLSQLHLDNVGDPKKIKTFEYEFQDFIDKFKKQFKRDDLRIRVLSEKILLVYKQRHPHDQTGNWFVRAQFVDDPKPGYFMLNNHDTVKRVKGENLALKTFRELIEKTLPPRVKK